MQEATAPETSTRKLKFLIDKLKPEKLRKAFPLFFFRREKKMKRGQKENADVKVWNKETCYLWDSIRLEILELLHKQNKDFVLICVDHSGKEGK